MATCQACEREMLDHTGCAMTHIEYPDGAQRQRTLYGAEALGGLPSTCGDCGAARGCIHHMNCDMEECPRCGRQLLGCDCRPVVLIRPFSILRGRR
jgi:hypothetical protein